MGDEYITEEGKLVKRVKPVKQVKPVNPGKPEKHVSAPATADQPEKPEPVRRLTPA